MNRNAGTMPISGRRVLVVEDEYFIAEDVAAALRRAGAVVIGPVASEAAATAALLASAAEVDCAVLDINLQGSLVFSLADTLAEQGIPFLFATGYSQESVPERFSGVPRLEKPFDLGALLQALPSLTTSKPAA